jgi:hypothetical protein
MSTSIIGITFWIVVSIVVIASLLYFHFKNLEFQKTIRFAIEKGMQLDADSIEKLMRKKPEELNLKIFMCPESFAFHAVSVF